MSISEIGIERSGKQGRKGQGRVCSAADRDARAAAGASGVDLSQRGLNRLDAMLLRIIACGNADTSFVQMRPGHRAGGIELIRIGRR